MFFDTFGLVHDPWNDDASGDASGDFDHDSDETSTNDETVSETNPIYQLSDEDQTRLYDVSDKLYGYMK